MIILSSVIETFKIPFLMKYLFISRSTSQVDRVLQNTSFVLLMPNHALSAVRGEVSLGRSAPAFSSQGPGRHGRLPHRL